jgi:hypothetical protein
VHGELGLGYRVSVDLLTVALVSVTVSFSCLWVEVYLLYCNVLLISCAYDAYRSPSRVTESD